MTYAERLKDPRWQKRRLEILQRDEWMCQSCADDKATLHVHHRRYISGRAPWEYEDSDLVTLCERCHDLFTETRRTLDTILGQLRIQDLQAVLGFAKAVRMADLSPLRLAPETFPELCGFRAVTGFSRMPKLLEVLAEAERRIENPAS